MAKSGGASPSPTKTHYRQPVGESLGAPENERLSRTKTDERWSPLTKNNLSKTGASHG